MNRYTIDVNKIIGNKYNRWTILEYYPKIKKLKLHSKCLCLCDCGKKKIVDYYEVTSGMSKSCGCLQKEYATRHGLCFTSEYRAWIDIKTRCYKKNCKAFKYYGGRGIQVCESWLNSFDNFIKDMGSKPSPELSLDRIDNDGNYEPSNCRWATRKEQIFNRRTETKEKVKLLCIKCGTEYFVRHGLIGESKHCGWKCRTGKERIKGG